MKIRLFPILCLLPLFFLSSCHTVEQPKGSSRGYKSVRLVRPHSAPAFADRDNRVNHAIQSALASTFHSHGFDIEFANADLSVAYLILLQDNVTTELVNDYFGFGRSAMDIADLAHERGVIRNHSADYYKAGTVVIDIIDNRTGKLVYRDYATRDVTGDLSDAQLQTHINSAVQQALAKFFRN